MAVIDVGFVSKNWKTSVNDKGQRETTYTHIYKVVLDDDPDTDEDDIINADGLPDLFDEYETDFSARLRSKTPTLFNDESRKVYNVACEWSTTTPPESQEENPDDPLSAPVEVSTGTITLQKVMEVDLDDTYIKNVLGYAYDPPLEDTVYVDVVTFVQNVPNYTRATARSYKGKVSSTALAGDAAGEWLCVDISSEKVVNHDPPYYRVTYVFHVLEGGWQPRILEASWVVVNDAMDLVKPTDDKGEPLSGPAMIDADGEQTTTPLYTQYRTKGSANFNALGLPFE